MNKQTFTARAMACERRMYRIARTLLHCDADCEDAVQEALLRAWAKRHTLREEQYFETWLVRILINECKNILRRRSANTEPLPESLAAPAADPALMNALMNLPEKHRIPVELRYIEGYSIREIAGVLRLPEGTVKWRLNRGRTLLAQELGEEV